MDILKSLFKRDYDSNVEKLGPLNSVEDQSEDERKIVSFVKSKADESRMMPARIAMESTFLTNTAYLLGYDQIYFDSKTRQYRSYGSNFGVPQRGRIHANLILPNAQNRLARLCKNPPRYDVRPESSSEESKDAARLATKVIQNVWDERRINEKRQELYMLMQQAGHAWGKVCWDPMLGKQMVVKDENGQDTLEREGDIDFIPCSAMEIFPDPLAKTQEELQHLLHAKVRKLSYFVDHYPERGRLVKEEGAWLLSIQNQLKINNMTQRGGSSGTGQQMKNAAIELAYYEAPSKKYSKGRMIITANGVLLSYKDLPIGEIPYTKFDDVKIGGKFYSESVITHARPLQDQWNRNLRKKAEYINKGLALKFLAPKGHGLIAEALNDTTEVVEYNPVPGGAAPQPMQSPQMPQYVFAEDNSLKGAFNEVFGVAEVSKGQMPSASIPAIGMQLLVEQDDTRIGVITESLENGWAQVGRHIAKYASKYYQTERYLKEAGRDGTFQIKKFTGEDLKDSHDVIVIRGSTIPGSKVLKRQEILNLYGQGLLGDPTDPALREKVLGALEFGDISEAWEDLIVDMNQIKRSIVEIESGVPPQVYEADNHKLHYLYKNRIRKSDKFIMYSEDVKQLFLNNMEEHLKYLTQFQTGVSPKDTPLPEEQELGQLENESDPSLNPYADPAQEEKIVTEDTNLAQAAMGGAQ